MVIWFTLIIRRSFWPWMCFLMISNLQCVVLVTKLMNDDFTITLSRQRQADPFSRHPRSTTLPSTDYATKRRFKTMNSEFWPCANVSQDVPLLIQQ